MKSTKSIALLVLLWAAISALGALQTYSDNLRIGVVRPYSLLFATWFVEYAVPLIVLSLCLNRMLSRYPLLIERPKNVVVLFVGLVLVFQPAQWVYMAWLRGYLPVSGAPEIWKLLMKMLLVGWFSTTGTFAAILAVNYWRHSQERQRALQQSQVDMLNLKLAWEEQRVLALRTQLEPHFLFNALNAISSLVREGDKRIALGGISVLSDLLRYVLSASAVSKTTLAAELQFVRDYLDLQRLRYGDRLRVSVEGESDILQKVECPPLFLQPLVDNALRHDLDGREGVSDIALCFEVDGDNISIRVSNPHWAVSTVNPGAGLGLANTRDRLRLMHSGASLHAGQQGNRFVAEVRLPLCSQDN